MEQLYPVRDQISVNAWSTMATKEFILKFQSVVLPDGLIGHLYGPVGRLL